jgi:hypothetical protein
VLEESVRECETERARESVRECESEAAYPMRAGPRNTQRPMYSDEKVANHNVSRVGDRSRGRFATPADSPLQDCSPYSQVHVRRESLGFVHRSRTLYLSPRAKPYDFATFSAAVQQVTPPS